MITCQLCWSVRENTERLTEPILTYPIRIVDELQRMWLSFSWLGFLGMRHIPPIKGGIVMFSDFMNTLIQPEVKQCAEVLT